MELVEMRNPYELNEEAPAFSYTRAELFNTIMNIVAHPHQHLTEHDKARTAAIFLVIGDYLDNHTESDNNHGHVIYEKDETDFEGYVMELLKIEEYGQATVTEVLK
jgi:hypothetical protein